MLFPLVYTSLIRKKNVMHLLKRNMYNYDYSNYYLIVFETKMVSSIDYQTFQQSICNQLVQTS